VKWFLAGLVTVLVLGPGVFAMRRGGGDRNGSRPWLGKGAAFAVAGLWVLAVIALVRAV